MSPQHEATIVVCPYCGESVEVFIEADVRGEMFQDCEVCCNPWQMRVRHCETGPQISVETLDE